MGTGKDTQLHELDARPSEPTAPPSRATPASRHSPEVELELERLRAERDAMAAELQIERAERLHVEERLRLLEREKLEQLRQGAASREKLASELEEARLRAMRSEARQAALEADTRLQEIESRRRGPWAAADGGLGLLTNEIAEPGADELGPDEAAGDEPQPGPPPAPARGRAIPLAGPSTASRFAKSRPADGESGEPAGAGAGSIGSDRARAGAGASAKPAAERRPPVTTDPPLPTSRLRGPATAPAPPPPRPPVDARGPGARTPPRPGGPDAGARAGRRGHEPIGGAHAAAQGGAAAGRPSIDRAQLEAKLAAGAVIKITERFRQFQPVAHSHIKVCDWLQEARTLAEIDARSAGQVAPTEILNVLVLFFERSFLVLDQS